MIDRETIAVYDARAAEYAALTESDSRDRQLAAFIADMPPGGRVLDLGCGPGTAAAEMARAGLAVHATDASSEMVAAAAAHAGVTAWQASFDEIAGENLYDGIWANFSLLHAARADMPAHLAALRRALKPGGRFHIGMKTGTGSARDGIGRHYTYYSHDELAGLLAGAGLTVFETRSGEGVGLDGVVAPWVVMTARG